MKVKHAETKVFTSQNISISHNAHSPPLEITITVCHKKGWHPLPPNRYVLFSFINFTQYFLCLLYASLLNAQSWTKGWRQIHKTEQNRFFYGMFYSWFLSIFYQKTSKFGFWVDGWVLAIKTKHFRDFLEIPNFLKF